MRMSILMLALILGGGFKMCGHARPNAPTATSIGLRNPAASASFAEVPGKVDFATQVKPILESRCQPCHFPGGKVFERMPFDRPETIKTLGTKLFTRIKDEDERRVIREFLAQP
jgi:hypothetical protein